MKQKIILYKEFGEVISNIEFLLKGDILCVERTGDEQQTTLELAQKDSCLLLYYVNGGENCEEIFQTMVILKKFRADTNKPIVAIGNVFSESMKVSLFSAGVDDCIDSTCSALEAVARIKAHIAGYLRLTEERWKAGRRMTVGKLEIDEDSQTVSVEGKQIRMTPVEFKILSMLTKEKGKVFSTKQIYETVWKMDSYGADNIVAVHIRHIREKIENNPQEPKYLQVVWGRGYKVG